MSRDSSLCFSHLASWACFANVVVGYYGNVRSVVRHLVSRFSFPIRNLVTKCDLRCLVVWRFPNPIWKLDLGSVPAITALPILVGLTQLSILSFRQDDHLGNAAYYDRFTTRVEVARQAGVHYYSPALLEDKATQLKLGDYDTLATDVKKSVVNLVEQEYLAYLFLNNSNAKLHSQLKKDVANDYSKGNTEAYPTG